MRYIDNARLQLHQAGEEDKFYVDEKYVKSACGIAYSGILKGLDFLFEIKGVPKKKGRKSIEYYQSHLASLDRKLLNYFNNAYRVLHLNGYYEGETKINTIETGFDSALSIIDSLKPYSDKTFKI